MRQFKVISLSVGGLGNKIFKSGDIVKEANFPPGNADMLVKERHLIEIESDIKTIDSDSSVDHQNTLSEDESNQPGLDDGNKVSEEDKETKTPVADALMNAFEAEEKHAPAEQNNSKKNKKK